MDQQKIPTLKTIREIADEGWITEYQLRRMLVQGTLPCVFYGKKAMVKYEQLLEMVNGDQPVAGLRPDRGVK